MKKKRPQRSPNICHAIHPALKYVKNLYTLLCIFVLYSIHHGQYGQCWSLFFFMPDRNRWKLHSLFFRYCIINYQIQSYSTTYSFLFDWGLLFCMVTLKRQRHEVEMVCTLWYTVPTLALEDASPKFTEHLLSTFFPSSLFLVLYHSNTLGPFVTALSIFSAT